MLVFGSMVCSYVVCIVKIFASEGKYAAGGYWLDIEFSRLVYTFQCSEGYCLQCCHSLASIGEFSLK